MVSILHGCDPWQCWWSDYVVGGIAPVVLWKHQTSTAPVSLQQRSNRQHRLCHCQSCPLLHSPTLAATATGNEVLLQACDPTNSLVSECLAITGRGALTDGFTNTNTQSKHHPKASNKGKGGGRGGTESQEGDTLTVIQVCCWLLLSVVDDQGRGWMTDLPGRISTRASKANPRMTVPTRLETPSYLNL